MVGRQGHAILRFYKISEATVLLARDFAVVVGVAVQELLLGEPVRDVEESLVLGDPLLFGEGWGELGIRWGLPVPHGLSPEVDDWVFEFGREGDGQEKHQGEIGDHNKKR